MRSVVATGAASLASYTYGSRPPPSASAPARVAAAAEACRAMSASRPSASIRSTQASRASISSCAGACRSVLRPPSIQRSFQSRSERYERRGAAGLAANRSQARALTDTADTPAGPPIAFCAPMMHMSTPHASGSTGSAPIDATASR